MNKILDEHPYFCNDMEGWNSYKPLLIAALEKTSGPVLELGMGSGSTPALHEYCKRNNRKLFSYENNAEYTSKFTHYRSDFHTVDSVTNWDDCPIDSTRWSVVLVDHAPGERRVVDVRRLASNADILVLHDTEPEHRYGYFWDQIWQYFKHIRHDETYKTCWATAVSNFVDLGELNVPVLPPKY